MGTDRIICLLLFAAKKAEALAKLRIEPWERDSNLEIAEAFRLAADWIRGTCK